MRVLKRTSIAINVVAGDSVLLTYTDEHGVRRAVVDQPITRQMVFDEAMKEAHK